MGTLRGRVVGFGKVGMNLAKSSISVKGRMIGMTIGQSELRVTHRRLQNSGVLYFMQIKREERSDLVSVNGANRCFRLAKWTCGRLL